MALKVTSVFLHNSKNTKTIIPVNKVEPKSNLGSNIKNGIISKSNTKINQAKNNDTDFLVLITLGLEGSVIR